MAVVVMAVVAGLAIVKLGIPIVEVQTDTEGRTALLERINSGDFHCIAQGESPVNTSIAEVLTDDCAPIFEGDREGAFNGNGCVCNTGHFGTEVPRKGEKRIEAPGVVRVSNIGQGLVASASVLANLYHVG